MRKAGGIRKLASLAVAVAVAMVLAPATGTANAAGRRDCRGQRQEVNSLTVDIKGERRVYRTKDLARVEVLVTRRVGALVTPIQDASIVVMLSQGRTHNGGTGATDGSGLATVRVPLEWFGAGHIDVRAYAWNQITPSYPCVPEVGEVGDAIALDLFRIIRR